MSIIRKDKTNVMGHWVCDLCKYTWESIRESPKCCPRCHRYDWNNKVDSSATDTPTNNITI